MKGKAAPIETDSLTKELLETHKCYILDCGLEVFVWLGRNSSLDERKSASEVAEVMPSISCSEIVQCLTNGTLITHEFMLVNKQALIRDPERLKSHVIRVIEGFETLMFMSKFDSWPQAANVSASEDSRGKVAG